MHFNRRRRHRASLEEVPDRVGNGPSETLCGGGALGNRFEGFRPFLLIVAAWLVGCGADPDSGFAPRDPRPFVADESAKTADPEGRGEAAPGEVFLRVTAGVVVRKAPESEAEVIATVPEDALLPVRESRGEFHRVKVEGGSDGWIRGGLKAKLLTLRTSRLPPQEATLAAEDVLNRATAVMDGPRRTACGPYKLLTDVKDPSLERLCARVGSKLDGVFQDRYGVSPKGAVRETLIVFRQRSSLNRFAAVDGPGRGYAGHARGSDGYLAMHWSSPATDESARTLVHEMTHLVARRSLGAPLPRWLSEGLADGLGDPATLHGGLGPIEGLGGVEAQARRVLERPSLPDLETLTALDRQGFDAGSGARDYEQSAVFVRFLMSDPLRRKAFQGYLRSIAAGESASARHLLKPLGVDSWDELDRELRSWLAATLR